MATLGDVAARARVSISTVSRVLSNDPRARVSAATRERIQHAAEELKYRPNFAARALKITRTHVIVLVIPQVTNAIFTDLMRGAEDEAKRLGYMLLLARAEGVLSDDESILRLVGEGRVDGLLVQGGDTMETSELAAITSGQAPVVMINSQHGKETGSVLLEEELAARMATEHLLDLGHEHIGLITGAPQNQAGQRRRYGFEEALARADLSPIATVSVGHEPHHGQEGFRSLLSRRKKPTGVVVANAHAAIGALLEARNQGVRVPEQLSLIAIHDAWTADNTWPPLTTIRMPMYALGAMAVQALWERINHNVTDKRLVRAPKPEIVLRHSTQPPLGTT